MFEQVSTKDMTVSTLFGACVGVATKRFTKDAMYGIGLGFMALQTLSYFGYVSINWNRVEEDVTKLLDQDGNGKLDKADLQILWNRFQNFMKSGLPNAAGFTTGFALAVKFTN